MSDSNHNGPSFIVFLWVRLRVLTTNLYALTTGKSSFMAGVVLFNSANSIVTCDTTAFPPGVFCTVETVINKCPRFPPSEEVLLPQHHSWTSWTDLKPASSQLEDPVGWPKLEAAARLVTISRKMQQSLPNGAGWQLSSWCLSALLSPVNTGW